MDQTLKEQGQLQEMKWLSGSTTVGVKNEVQIVEKN